MATVSTYKEYLTDKEEFLAAHGYDYRVELHRRDTDGKILKDYVCADGARWTEESTKVREQCEVELKELGCKAWAEVQLIKTEYWASDDMVVFCFYEACALDKYSH